MIYNLKRTSYIWKFMPIYEFVCLDCSHRFEVLTKVGINKTECPDCRSLKTEKQLSSFSISKGNTPNSIKLDTKNSVDSSKNEHKVNSCIQASSGESTACAHHYIEDLIKKYDQQLK